MDLPGRRVNDDCLLRRGILEVQGQPFHGLRRSLPISRRYRLPLGTGSSHLLRGTTLRLRGLSNGKRQILDEASPCESTGQVYPGWRGGCGVWRCKPSLYQVFAVVEGRFRRASAVEKYWPWSPHNRSRSEDYRSTGVTAHRRHSDHSSRSASGERYRCRILPAQFLRCS